MSSNDSNDVGVLNFKFDQMSMAHNAMQELIDNIDDKLLNPDRGAFAKISALHGRVNGHDDEIDENRKDIDKLVDVCTKNEHRTAVIESWIVAHEKRDEEIQDALQDAVEKLTDSVTPLNQDFQQRMKVKKWTDKILWLIISSLIVGLLPTIKYVMFDAQADKDRVERLEQIILEQQKKQVGTPRGRIQPQAQPDVRRGERIDSDSMSTVK